MSSLAIGHRCTMGLFTKNQNWVMSLTSCRLWDNTADHKRSITHKLLSWDNISDLFWCNVTHPLISTPSAPAIINIVTTNLCFTQLFVGDHLSHGPWVICYVKTLQCYLPPHELLQVFTFIMAATYLPVHLLPSKFHMLMCSFFIKACTYPEMGKFWKNCQNNIVPCPIFMLQNMSRQYQC